MNVKVHYQSDEPGVMVDFTLEGERYIVISDDVTDCGQPSMWRYTTNQCRCSACKATWSEYQRDLRVRTAKAKARAKPARVPPEVCSTCGRRLKKRKRHG